MSNEKRVYKNKTFNGWVLFGVSYFTCGHTGNRSNG